MLLKLKNRSGQRNRSLLRSHGGQALAHSDALGQLFAIEFVQQRFVIEQVHLRWRAALKQVNDALGFGGEVRETGKSARHFLFVSSKEIFRQQARKGHNAKAPGAPGEELTASDEKWISKRGVHIMGSSKIQHPGSV